jgi:hypothetical protein
MKKLFNKQNVFVFLMIISTLALAGSAAYYSVFGLSSLFAGARTEVVIMAAALEFSKLIIASYLHNHWDKAGWMKWYLTLAVGVLMVITSAGIYGFLTSAYQKTADQLGVLDKQVQVIELKKDRFQESLDGYASERTQLNTSISELTKGLSNNVITYTDADGNQVTTTSSATRRVLTQQLDDMKSQRDVVSIKMESLTDSITSLELKVLDLESNNEVAGEVGPLRYMAQITGRPMNVIVNWFTLLIVFVFDPLAISMVIALNKLTNKTKDYGNEDNNVNLNFDISDDTTIDNREDVDDKHGNEVSVPSNEVADERVEVTKEKIKESPKKVKEIKEEKRQRGDVKFVPTDEEGRSFYGEKQVRTKPKHIYKDAIKRK